MQRYNEFRPVGRITWSPVHTIDRNQILKHPETNTGAENYQFAMSCVDTMYLLLLSFG